jgi:hypothetical protein
MRHSVPSEEFMQLNQYYTPNGIGKSSEFFGMALDIARHCGKDGRTVGTLWRIPFQITPPPEQP